MSTKQSAPKPTPYLTPAQRYARNSIIRTCWVLGVGVSAIVLMLWLMTHGHRDLAWTVMHTLWGICGVAIFLGAFIWFGVIRDVKCGE